MVLKQNQELAPDVCKPLFHDIQGHEHTEFVVRVYHLLTRTIQPPYAISIDGLWGTGKTTVMHTLQDQLSRHGYPVFWFNPWKYRQTDNVVLAFLQSLYLSAADSRSFPDLSAQGTTILQLLVEAGLDAGLKLLARGKAPAHSASVSASVPFDDFLQAHRTIEQEFVELLLLISRHYTYKPVMIFVDDLDRCLPSDVLHFLQALKHVFLTQDSKGIFVCGIDTHVACQYLVDTYPHKGSAFAAHFFQHIFPLTLSMPYSANVKEVIFQAILRACPRKMTTPDQAETLTTMIYTRGLQSHITSIRKFLNIVTGFAEFLRSHPQYRWQPENDFVLNLLVIKEAWPDLYADLLQDANQHQLTMQQLIQHGVEQHRLQAPQEKFLTAYVGQHTPFATEFLSLWSTLHPLLN